MEVDQASSQPLLDEIQLASSHDQASMQPFGIWFKEKKKNNNNKENNEVTSGVGTEHIDYLLLFYSSPNPEGEPVF